MSSDPKERFSNRVEFYAKYRPSYPEEIIDFMKSEMNLKDFSTIADIGCGTGLLTRLFLDNGNPVYGIEPNGEMRYAAERLLEHYARFHVLHGEAEKTPLASKSMDFIVAGQSFHWFDREKAGLEFKRILKPGGWVVLIWNTRKTDETEFLREYESLLDSYALDYHQVDHRKIDKQVLSRFFGERGYRQKLFINSQVLNYAGLEGRLLSSSYAPMAGHPNYAPMMSQLKQIFDTNQEAGKVQMLYDTEIYYGHLAKR